MTDVLCLELTTANFKLSGRRERVVTSLSLVENLHRIKELADQRTQQNIQGLIDLIHDCRPTI